MSVSTVASQDNIIEELTVKIRDLKKVLTENKKINVPQKKKFEKDLRRLEEQLNQAVGFNNLEIGDWVKNLNDNKIGRIEYLRQNKTFFEAWVIWEKRYVAEPIAPNLLSKQDRTLFRWSWTQDKSAIIRLFDHKECDDFKILEEFAAILEISNQQINSQNNPEYRWIINRWQEIVKDRFRVNDRIKYQKSNGTIIHHEYEKEFLFCWVKFDDTTQKKINPKELIPTGIAQLTMEIDRSVLPCELELAISQIKIDSTLQGRVNMDLQTITEYQQLLLEGEKLDPVKIILDEKYNYWLWDGFHTVAASKLAQRTYVPSYIESGTYDEAFIKSLGANSKRGLKLTQQDKRNNVKRALQKGLTDSKGKLLSDRKIAKLCCVSNTFVSDLKKELFPPEIVLYFYQDGDLQVDYGLEKRLQMLQEEYLGKEKYQKFSSQSSIKRHEPTLSWLQQLSINFPELVELAIGDSRTNKYITIHPLKSSKWLKAFETYTFYFKQCYPLEQKKDVQKIEEKLLTRENKINSSSSVSDSSKTATKPMNIISKSEKTIIEPNIPKDLPNYSVGNIVFIKNTSIDKRLIGHKKSCARVVQNNQNTVDLEFWGHLIIEHVAKDDIGLMNGRVNLLARITVEQLSVLIASFESPEIAIQEFVNYL